LGEVFRLTDFDLKLTLCRSPSLRMLAILVDRFISGRLPDQSGAGASHRKTEVRTQPGSPERQLHSLMMLSGLLDIKLFQSVEYPVGKQFMCKTIGMWIGRRHPQLR
jgi:hypothetical protein